MQAIRFLLRAAVIHSITYFVAGIIASRVFDYAGLFALPVIRDFMQPYGSASLTWGPFLQPIRGLVLGLAILPFRGFLAGERLGWLYLWLVFLCIGILGTPAAAPASMEGVIYSRLPLWYHLIGLPEICLQTLAFSWLLHFYLRNPGGIVDALPSAFGVALKALAGACLAFMGYALVSILFALSAGMKIEASGENMSLRTQGQFLLPLALNFAVILASALGKLPGLMAGPKAGIMLSILAYAGNAIALAAYQAIFLSGPGLLYVLVAPILPALITGFVARPRPAAKAA